MSSYGKYKSVVVVAILKRSPFKCILHADQIHTHELEAKAFNRNFREISKQKSGDDWRRQRKYVQRSSKLCKTELSFFPFYFQFYFTVVGQQFSVESFQAENYSQHANTAKGK